MNRSSSCNHSTMPRTWSSNNVRFRWTLWLCTVASAPTVSTWVRVRWSNSLWVGSWRIQSRRATLTTSSRWQRKCPAVSRPGRCLPWSVVPSNLLWSNSNGRVGRSLHGSGTSCRTLSTWHVGSSGWLSVRRCGRAGTCRSHRSSGGHWWNSTRQRSIRMTRPVSPLRCWVDCSHAT